MVSIWTQSPVASSQCVPDSCQLNMDYQISDQLQERFLGLEAEAEGRIAQWSMGGAMFGLTAAVVQMLIRSLVIKRNKVGVKIMSTHHQFDDFLIFFQENRRIDRANSARRRIGERRIETSRPRYLSDRSPMIIDDRGGVRLGAPVMMSDEDRGLVGHVVTYPYIVPVYYNYGKYNLNNLNEDYHKTTTTLQPPSEKDEEEREDSPWDRINDIELPDSYNENLHSVFSIRNYKQFATEKDAEVYDSEYESDYGDSSFYEDEESEPKKITRRYLKTYFS